MHRANEAATFDLYLWGFPIDIDVPFYNETFIQMTKINFSIYLPCLMIQPLIFMLKWTTIKKKYLVHKVQNLIFLNTFHTSFFKVKFWD